MLSLCLGIKISGGRQQFIGTLSLDLYTTVKTPVVIANVACGCPANIVLMIASIVFPPGYIFFVAGLT